MFMARVSYFFAVVIGIGFIVWTIFFASESSERILAAIFGAGFILAGIVYKRRYKCRRCGAQWSMETIDTEIIGRSSPFQKKSDSGNYKTFERQNLLVTRRCKKCGNTTQHKEEKDVQLA